MEREADAPKPTTRLGPASLQRLQGRAGNRAVAALVAQRKAASAPKAPVKAPAPEAAQAASASVAEADLEPVQRLEEGPTHRPGAASDPKFKNLKTDVSNKASTMRAHPPATKEADAAAKAAKPPADDKEAQGKAANAEKMNAAKPGEFDKAAFIKAVNDAIAAGAEEP